jgi:two-component sensor histidine kinase
MSSSRNSDDRIVEAKRNANPEETSHALQQRIHQQEILAELGVTALQGVALDKLLADTARLTAEGLQVEFSKILEYIPAENRLLVRAGVGWGPGVVGVASIGADTASPAGFALRTGTPVISNQLENEERFRTPEMLQQHGVRRAMNVILQGDGVPFGVLEVDSRSETAFEEHDLTFLQGAANILGMAIERERHERKMKAALQRHQVLLKELNHRVKNSLTIVAGMLRLQARDVDDVNLTRHLDDAAQRVTAVARAHDQLYRGSDIERMDVGKYIEAVCKDLDVSVLQCEIHAEAQNGIEIANDRAISCALIVNELVANASKYAYKDQAGGNIWVRVAAAGDKDFSISVRDEGCGLPATFDPRKARGLGMRIVNSLVQQLDGIVTFQQPNPGTEVVITIPRVPLEPID